MKLSKFFDNFEQLADTPDAVAKMRKLIFDSAIRGKIVSQNDNDEHASELLKRISSVQARQVRNYMLLPPVNDDAYFQIPPRWAWTRLGNTGRIFNGNSVNESGKAELAKVNDGLPFIATKDVGYGRESLIYDNGLKVAPRDARFKIAHANAVLICAEGGSAGRKVGITDRDICFGNKLLANEVWDGIDYRYIFYVYQAPTFYEEFAARMTGIIGGIPRSEFLSLPIPIPPLAEQKRIVAKVDELMALCDKLEAQLKERDTLQAALARAALARFAEAPTPENLGLLFHEFFTVEPSDLRKAILDLAVRGKLVRQDPEDEPANSALLRIKNQRNLLEENKVFRKVNLTPQIIEKSFGIPTSWVWTSLGNAMLNITDGFHSTPKTTENGIPYILATHVKPEGIDFNSSLFVSRENYTEIASKTRAKKGDILIVNIGAGSGTPAIIDVEYEFAFKNVAILNRPVDITSRYLFFYLLLIKDQLFSERTKGGAQPFISLSVLRELPFPLPPLAEQHRIISKLDQLMALVDQYETQLNASRELAEKLLEAMVAELTSAK
ncbi:MAG: restriction endonuclease subunit S [Anaerolineales bacterium]|nr:restriction endonuclease subunit S [Anaerolineales bacterium]